MRGWKDAGGTSHAACGGDARIVSLVPSLTELLFDLGLGAQVVGRTGFCIHPREQVRAVPKVGGTKDPDFAKIRALAPTHVVLNIDENRREDAEVLREFVPNLVVTHPNAPADNLGLYALLGGIFQRESAALALAAQFERALAAVRPGAATPGERVLYLIWREPWMGVSRETYISQMLALVGWQTVPVAPSQRYPVLQLEALAGSVDRVLLSSEPYPFRERHLDEVRAALPGLPVQLIDGEMISWYGSRAIAGLDYLQHFHAANAASTLDASRSI